MKAQRSPWLALLVGLAVACSSDVPPPPMTSPGVSPSPSPAATSVPTESPSATPQRTPPPKVVGDLELEMCDPEGLLPCEHQAAVLVVPIAASGVSLTYSTEWADGRTDRPKWNADALGLGGWALDILQRYDPEHGILLSGDGSWREADTVDLPSGEQAVPTHDGFRYFVFDSEWRHVRTVDSVTGATLVTFTYSEDGRLAEVRGQLEVGSVELTMERTSEGVLLALLGTESTRTGAAIDIEGRLTALVTPDGTTLYVTFAAFGLVANWRMPGRGAVSLEYDDAGRVTKEADADGVARAISFANTGSAVSVSASDANGGTATFQSERIGDALRRTFTDTDGTVTQLDTSADGSTRFVEPDGTVTTTGAVPHPRWGLAAPILTPLVETRPDGTEYRVTTSTTMGTGTPEPAGGPWRTETIANGATSVDAYDPMTRTLTTIDPAGRVSSRVFDEHGRLVQDRAADQSAVIVSYDPIGRVASIAVGEGEAAAMTTYAYEVDTGDVVETQPDGATVRYSYNELGALVRESSDGENVTMVRDAAGNVIQIRAGSHPATSFGFSEQGRPTAHIPPAVGDDSSYERMTYTPAGQLSTISGPGQRAIEIGYDSAGRVAGWTFDRGSSTFAYGAQSGLLDSSESPDGVTTSFGYIGWVPVGRAWIGPVEGAVQLTVDGQLRTTAETVNGGDAFAFAYDEAGLPTAIDTLAIERDPATGLPVQAAIGAVRTTSEFDENRRLVSVTTTTANGEQVLALRYSRDALGRIVNVQRTEGNGDTSTTAYSYDASGRVLSVARDGASEQYAYDSSGNRVGVATYDDRDRLQTFADTTFRYSPDGTLLEREGPDGLSTYDFDDLGALRSVVLPDGRSIEYVIDAGGRRIGRMVDGTLTDGYLYSVDDTVVAWTDGSGRVIARFAYDELGRLALVRRGGTDLLVVTDQVGSPVALVESGSGDVVQEVTYDAWGDILAGSELRLIPFGFAGGLRDPDTGLVHFGARDYDPAVGRWTAPDPLRYSGGDINLYRYANGDPVNLVDPSGTRACAPGSCDSAGHGDQTSADAGTKRGGATGGGRRGPGGGGRGGGGGGGGKKPPGALDCLWGVCRPSDPAKPNRPSAGEICVGSICFPADGSRYPGGAGNNYDRPGRPEGLGSPNIFGEPHVLTLDGLHYDFQAAGEFVVAASADGIVQVQARFEPPGSSTTITRTTGLALFVNGDRVAFYANAQRSLVINGEAIERAEYSQSLPGGGVVERQGTQATVEWPDGTTLFVHLYARFINFGLDPSDATATSLDGLVGSRDGDTSNDLATRDGVVIDPEDPSFTDLLYGDFANSWRISQEESLFDYLPAESTATFQRPEIPSEPATLDSLDDETRANAEALCRAVGVTTDPILSDCILDFGLTGDSSYVGSALTVAAALERESALIVDLGTAVEVGQSVNAELLAGRTDRYTFRVEAETNVYLDALGECADDLGWRLLRPTGTWVAFDWTCIDLGRRVLDQAGTWTIEVYSDSGAGGEYAFRTIDVPPVEQGTVATGQTVSGETSAIGAWDRYALTATAGQVIYLDAKSDCVDELWWRLLRPDGALSTFAATCNDLGRRVLDVAGDWVIEVYSDEVATGPYSFDVIAAPVPQEATVATGQPASGEISAIGEWDRYTLTATAGQVAYFDAHGDCVDGLWWRLLRPDGVLSTFAATCNDLGRRVLDVAGDWVVEFYSDELATGSYAFGVIAAPAVRESTVSVGQSVNGEIASVGEWHRYTLEATAGLSVNLDAQGDCVEGLWWRLLRPDGVLSTFAAVCNDMGARTLDVDGSWIIEIYSDGLVTGPYSFRVDAAP